MTLAEWLQPLLTEGKILLDHPVGFDEKKDAAACSVLEWAYREHAQEIAGPPLDFAPKVALAAARFLARASWFLVSRGETSAAVAVLLRLTNPAVPADHLNGDMLLRFLPQLHQRAFALNSADILTRRITEVLRCWPLSGALANLDEAPLGSVSFGRHRGLQLLYAERLADHFKPAWVPPNPDRQYVELVWEELGKDPSVLQMNVD